MSISLPAHVAQGLSNKNKFNENQEQVKEVAAHFASRRRSCTQPQVSCPPVLRGSPPTPAACLSPEIEHCGKSVESDRTIQPAESAIEDVARAARSSFVTLTTTVEGKKARNDMIREVVQKRRVSAAVKKLQADLTSEQLHLQEVDERNEIIAKLKEDLVAVRTKSSIETISPQSSTLRHRSTVLTAHKRRSWSARYGT